MGYRPNHLNVGVRVGHTYPYISLLSSYFALLLIRSSGAKYTVLKFFFLFLPADNLVLANPTSQIWIFFMGREMGRSKKKEETGVITLCVVWFDFKTLVLHQNFSKVLHREVRELSSLFFRNLVSPFLVENDFLYLIGCQVYWATDGDITIS